MNDEPTLFDILTTPRTPVAPYGGTSGWSGSSTSRERAETYDSTGVTSYRQRRTMALLSDAGSEGMTWVDLAQALDVHHGAASGVLSTLHKVGAICRVERRRNRCQVYVLRQHVRSDDVVVEYRPNVSARMMLSILTEIAQDLDNGQIVLARDRIGATINAMTDRK